MDNSIVGVRYVGKKERQEDTVCKTGAVWVQGQVHNFANGLAKQLLEHTDSFALAELDMDGQTFMSAGKSKPRETAAYINLSGMTEAQLVHMARFEFNRVVNPEGKSIEQLRQEVQSLMLVHSLDVIEDERKATEDGDYRVPVIYQATPEEYAAIKDGTLTLALIPSGAVKEIASELESLTNAGDDVIDLDSLSKEDLVALAKEKFQENIDRRKSLEAIRSRVAELLSADDPS